MPIEINAGVLTLLLTGVIAGIAALWGQHKSNKAMRDQGYQAIAKVEVLEKRLDELQRQFDELRAEHADTKEQNTELRVQNRILEEGRTNDARRIAAIEDQNVELRTQNHELRSQTNEGTKQITRLMDYIELIRSGKEAPPL